MMLYGHGLWPTGNVIMGGAPMTVRIAETTLS